ncbi:MAG TPA: FAD/NAD(P)-binding protein [Hyphomicrobiales bacterium]|nr:FAD/NAD(P)-binding protein [Hyphomicrobiales bacterium]
MSNRKLGRVVVIGGGASGVLAACHLWRIADGAVAVTIVEPRPELGRGLAFGTRFDGHLLNVRAGQMSALPDRPDDFQTWLAASGARLAADPRDPLCFVPRGLYGRYLDELVAHLPRPTPAAPAGLEHVRQQCVGLLERDDGVTALLADGTTVEAQAAILATGNEPAASIVSPVAMSPWDDATWAAIPRDGLVLTVGTGLTMADSVLSLLATGHRGPIVALSRRGLLPQPHGAAPPLALDLADIPLGTSIAYLTRWFRRLLRDAAGRGYGWRSVFDGLRPHLRAIWQNLPPDSRARFLRHARPLWDVHRHRLAPSVDAALHRARGGGQLTIVAGRLVSAEATAEGAVVRYRRRGGGELVELRPAAVIECIGLASDPLGSANPLLRDLLARGAARPDLLGIGLDVTRDGALIDATGQPSTRIFAVGPPARAAFWEITSIPDIRTQSADTARKIWQELPLR